MYVLHVFGSRGWVEGEGVVVSYTMAHPGLSTTTIHVVIDVQPSGTAAFRTQVDKKLIKFEVPPGAGDRVPIRYDPKRQRARWDYRAQKRQDKESLRSLGEGSEADLQAPPGTPPTET